MAQTLAPAAGEHTRKTYTFASRTIHDAQDALTEAHNGLAALKALEDLIYRPHVRSVGESSFVDRDDLGSLLTIVRQHIDRCVGATESALVFGNLTLRDAAAEREYQARFAQTATQGGAA
ncbi:hypothetical protein EBQ34_01245 [Vandammella animalimorsus]|uniref:Uncharacterized protein n=1 Tax=Vandammella animalimorsus TaxID=2029117 RepID=A0A3M6RU43_9BURK|nr:hypothetical protein [Vandammella animalimorsus]RMX19009.1 hypothetical protein EBQ34_01245 [Vandammella animalimorsus]